MNDGPLLVDGDDFRRLADAARRAESYPQNARRLPRAAAPASAQSWYTARVTSGTADGNGYYPAVITVYDTVAAAWTDYDAVFVLPLNAEALANGRRYSVRPIGPYGTGLGYQVVQGAVGVTVSAVDPGAGDPAAFDVANVGRIRFDEASGIVTVNNGDGGTTESLAPATYTHAGVVSLGNQKLGSGYKVMEGAVLTEIGFGSVIADDDPYLFPTTPTNGIAAGLSLAKCLTVAGFAGPGTENLNLLVRTGDLQACFNVVASAVQNGLGGFWVGGAKGISGGITGADGTVATFVGGILVGLSGGSGSGSGSGGGGCTGSVTTAGCPGIPVPCGLFAHVTGSGVFDGSHAITNNGAGSWNTAGGAACPLAFSCDGGGLFHLLVNGSGHTASSVTCSPFQVVFTGMSFVGCGGLGSSATVTILTS